VVGGKLAKAGRNWTRVQEECDVGGGGAGGMPGEEEALFSI
jgi:hypothetical protein